MLKGGVPLSRKFLTALVRAPETCDTCTQNDKRGVPPTPLDPPLVCIVWQDNSSQLMYEALLKKRQPKKASPCVN